MGAVYDEFLTELEDLSVKYAGRPDQLRRRLYGLALEREQLVAVAYSEAMLRPRLDALGVPGDVRALIRQALAWLWRDEEMHAIFIRGTLLSKHTPLSTPSTFIQQTLGSVAGWTSAMKQHVAPVNAPFSHSLASLLASSAGAVGKLSPTLREELKQRSFRSFCEFNIDAERTAALCWENLVDMAENEHDRATFAAIAKDEDNHRLIFEAFFDALDERDQLRAGVTYEDLADKIRIAGDAYLPRSLRKTFRGPLGSAEPVYVYEGESVTEKSAVLERTLADAGLPALVEQAVAEANGGEVLIAVKTSFSLGYSRDDMSNVIDPEVLELLAQFLRRYGATDVAVLEAPSLYDQFYENRSVAEIAEYFGYVSDSYRIVDLSEDQAEYAFPRGLGATTLSETWRDAALRLSVPKLRSHCTERVHLCVANLQGLCGRLEDFLFYEKLAHWPAATVALADAFPPDFGLIDAYESAADGHFGVMACQSPKTPLRFYAGKDCLAIDCVAARDTGTLDPLQSEVLRTAVDWFGASTDAIPTHGVTSPIEPWNDPYRNEWSTLVSMIAYPIYVYGSDRGSFFVPRMDEKAFPVKGRRKPVLKALRRVSTSVLGLHPPS